MVVKINLRSIVLLLAVILILMSTNAVAIAQDGSDTETPTVPLPSRTPVQRDDDISSSERSPIIPGGPGFISIHPSAFQPKDSDTPYGFYDVFELFNPAPVDSDDGIYLAPVYPPNLAEFSQLVLYFYDHYTDDFLHIRLDLMSCDIGYSHCTTLTTLVSTVGEGPEGYGFETIDSFVNSKINLQTNSYLLKLTIPSGKDSWLTLVNVRLDYEYPTFMPTVRN